MRRYLLPVLLALLFVTDVAPAQTPRFRVGAKAFTEGIILGHLLANATERGRATRDHEFGLAGKLIWKALQRGDIDAYVEYTGTIVQEIYGGRIDAHILSIADALRRDGIRMMPPLGFNNTYAIGMPEKRARELGITTISDLGRHPELRCGFSSEFMDRRDGWPGLRERYGLAALVPRGLDHDLAYRGVANGDLDVIDLYSTDAEIEYYNLRILEDDLRYFPAYEAVVLYRAELDTTYPELRGEIMKLVGTIDEREMSSMNAAVKLRGASEESVARAFIGRGYSWDSTLATPAPSSSVKEAPANEQSVGSAVLDRTREHIWLVGISLLSAIILGIPLGIVASRTPWLAQLILGTTTILYTIPSLALLVMMIPLLGIGTTPVLTALFLYSLLPIVRNTVTGLNGIDRPLIESATALGLSAAARLRRVELPLALPTILAGIKTAAVMNVATATIGALIGAGGYGQPILTGIRLDDTGLILQGAVPAAVMALLLQGAFDLLERLVTPGRR